MPISWNNIKAFIVVYCNTGCANNWIADKYCDQVSVLYVILIVPKKRDFTKVLFFTKFQK